MVLFMDKLESLSKKELLELLKKTAEDNKQKDKIIAKQDEKITAQDKTIAS